MWPNEWPLTISRSLWPIFHASVILPFIFITISWRIVIPGLLYLSDKMIYISLLVWPILYGLMIKMLQYKMYPAGELAVLRQLLLFKMASVAAILDLVLPVHQNAKIPELDCAYQKSTKMTYYTPFHDNYLKLIFQDGVCGGHIGFCSSGTSKCKNNTSIGFCIPGNSYKDIICHSMTII